MAMKPPAPKNPASKKKPTMPKNAKSKSMGMKKVPMKGSKY